MSVAFVFYEHYPHSRLVDIAVKWLVITLVSGRLYTGMHGFTDIGLGCLLGVVSYYILQVGNAVLSPYSVLANSALTALIFGIIQTHPDPIESCPCFQDTVAFCGVVLGMMWTLCLGRCKACSLPMERIAGPLTVASLTAALVRFLVGVSVVVTWRLSSKPWSSALGRWITRYISRSDKNPSQVSFPVAIVLRLIVYGGIGPMVLEVAPMLIKALNV